MTPAPILRDPELDAELVERGFVISPLLDPTEVRQISEAYADLVPSGHDELVIDYLRTDRTIMRAISDLLRPYWERHLPELFLDGRPVLTTVVTKHPGPRSDMYLHDDRTYVDETAFRSATLWIPLVDVGPANVNGGLEVVAGSHRLPTGLAGTNTPDHIRPFEGPLRDLLEPVTVSAGSAVIYDTRLLHASGPNLSDASRSAIVCAVAPRAAKLVHVAATGTRTRRIHAVDERFFLENDPRSLERSMPAEYPVIEEFIDDTRLDAASVQRTLGLDRAPEASVPVPSDVRAGLPSGPFAQRGPSRHTQVPAHPAQRFTAAELGALPWPETLVHDPVEHGIVGRSVVRRNFRRGTSTAAGSTAPVQLMDHPLMADLVVIGIEAGGRLEFTTTGDGSTGAGSRIRSSARPGPAVWSRELVVLDCPAVGSGMANGGGAVAFNPGEVFDLSPGQRQVIWDDGPGIALLAMCRSPRVAGLGPLTDGLRNAVRRRSGQPT